MCQYVKGNFILYELVQFSTVHLYFTVYKDKKNLNTL